MQFNLITPEKPYLSCKASYVAIPSKDGVIGVLPKHMPLVCFLDEGILSVETTENINKTGGTGNIGDAGSISETSNAGGKTAQYYIAGGFAEINQKECSILSDRLIDIENQDKDLLKKQLEEAEETIKESIDESEISQAKKQAEFLRNFFKKTGNA